MQEIDVNITQIIAEFKNKFNIPIKRNSKNVIEKILIDVMISDSYSFDLVDDFSLFTNFDNSVVIQLFSEIRNEYLKIKEPRKIQGLKFDVDIEASEKVGEYILSKQISFKTNEDFFKLKELVINFIISGGNQEDYFKRVINLTECSIDDASELLINSFRKYMAHFNKNRLFKMGIEGFLWSDSGDSKVCADCRKRNGKLFLLSDPDLLFPGEREGCRCVAEAVDEFDGIEEMKRDPNFKYIP